MMLIKFKSLVLLMTVILFFNSNVHAKLIIVADLGGESAQLYYDELGLSSLSVNELIDNQLPSVLTAPVEVVQMLPVISTKLTPGAVSTKSIQAKGLSPFFIVGSDALSKEWLIARKDALLSIGAKGLVVNVKTSVELDTLQALAPELLLQPTYGDDIADRLNLEHYPVLITSEIITQ